MRLIIILLFVMPMISSAQKTDETVDTFQLNIGGALRYNYNYSTWKPNQVKRGGDLGFEVFRVEVDASYGKLSLMVDQRFYAQEFGGPFLKYGWMQYELTVRSHLKLGLIPAYFGTQQFNSHSWFFQLPFYLGFEDDHDMGLSYSYEDDAWNVDIGYYKNAEEFEFSDNSPISDSRYTYDFSGSNKEVNQVNFRTNYKYGQTVKQNVGLSIQYGGIWNIDTQDIGTQRALGLHYDMNYHGLNMKLQYLTYDNTPENSPGQSRDMIEMTAYGFPYQTAAKASVYSIGVAYTVPVKWGPITSLQFYNDYAYMDKSVIEWEDTQSNVLGVLLSANPIYIYMDYASGLHQPWLGPQWTNALATGDPENGWETRFNINIGYYF